VSPKLVIFAGKLACFNKIDKCAGAKIIMTDNFACVHFVTAQFYLNNLHLHNLCLCNLYVYNFILRHFFVLFDPSKQVPKQVTVTIKLGQNFTYTNFRNKLCRCKLFKWNCAVTNCAYTKLSNDKLCAVAKFS